MSNQPLGLVSFASQIETRDLESALIALGQSPVIISPATWFNTVETNHLPNPIVVFLGERDYPSSSIRSTLEARRTSVIAIFIRDVAAINPEIAASCRDFICWPCAEQELGLRIGRLCGSQELRQLSCDEGVLLEEFANLNLLGRSPVFVTALRLIKHFARCDAPVLIEGETGTGKDLAARAIHYLGARRDYPFIPINCGAIPDNLIENELFGHERGAFTDARDAQSGLIAQAEGGTLFLDEVEALTPKAQVALLRFLQDRRYRPLGGKRTLTANVRVITASNTSLEKLVGSNQFRQDLFFRINILSTQLPPLRKRPGDIELLAEHFMRRYREHYGQPDKYLQPATLNGLKHRPWPGNVRELENVLHQAFLLAERNLVSLSDDNPMPSERRNLLLDRRAGSLLGQQLNPAKSRLIAEFEKRYLKTLLLSTGGNVSAAARLAGKERRALGKLLKKHGITRADRQVPAE